MTQLLLLRAGNQIPIFLSRATVTSTAPHVSIHKYDDPSVSVSGKAVAVEEGAVVGTIIG